MALEDAPTERDDECGHADHCEKQRDEEDGDNKGIDREHDLRLCERRAAVRGAVLLWQWCAELYDDDADERGEDERRDDTAA